jgi:hypothetical protein
MNSPEPNDPLSRVLAEWRVQPPPHPNFRPDVWQRIRRQSRESWANYIRGHMAGWTMAALVAVTAAGWAGLAVGRAQLDAKRDAMVVAYLVDLDPRVQAKLRP